MYATSLSWFENLFLYPGKYLFTIFIPIYICSILVLSFPITGFLFRFHFWKKKDHFSKVGFRSFRSRFLSYCVVVDGASTLSPRGRMFCCLCHRRSSRWPCTMTPTDFHALYLFHHLPWRFPTQLTLQGGHGAGEKVRIGGVPIQPVPIPGPPPVGISTQQLSTQLYPRPSPVGTSTQQLSIQLVSSSSGQGGDTIECDLIWHSHEWGAEFVEWRAKGAHPREAVTDSP